MMINKKLGLLAAAVLTASGAQAAFEANETIAFVAVNAAGDTYVADLGSVSEFLGSGGVSVDPSALGAYTWTVYGTNVGSGVLAAPPGGATGFETTNNTGVITTSDSAATVTTPIANNNSVLGEISTVNDWLANVSAAAAGNSTVSIDAGNAGAFESGQMVAHQGAPESNAMMSGTGTVADFNLSSIYQSDLESGVLGLQGGAPAVSLLSGISFDGSTVSAVPVPAAAWLFGSALAGLTVIRRRK
jgi:hypothetical protein